MQLTRFLPYHRLPWVSAALTLAAVAVQLHPELAQRLALVPSGLRKGELWRLLTGHITHFNGAHAVGDIAAFAAWATAVEVRSRRLLVRTLLISALLVSVLILAVYPSLGEYRGLSAIDCTLAATLMAWGFDDPRLRRYPGPFMALSLCAGGLLAKTIFEFVHGHAILAPDLGRSVGLLPGAHAFGIVAGLLAFTSWRRAGPRPICSPSRTSDDRRCTPSCI
jgi:rhomboid family GlyGly-CTERM serine protease